MNKKVNAIIPAGGTSSRFGNTNKLLEKIDGKEVIKYTVDAFEASNVDEIIICANVSIIDELKEIFSDYKKIKIIEGGQTRQASVFNGLKNCECDYVLIHDGARPMITTDLINSAIEMVKDKKALTVATKTIDTIKEVVDGKIIRTIDRSKLYNTQTPQAFEYELIKKAHEKLIGQNFTDDAGMLEELGIDVYILNGSYKNIKITTQNDIEIAKVYLQ
jgi:2-C-methyl-D-erythritol 4-phosphate cytidylyltransferase